MRSQLASTLLSRLRVVLLPWGAVVLAPILLLGPAVARGQVLFWGTPLLQFIPWREYAVELVRAGWLPLWNPLVGMGAPLLANYQSALLYPPNWLLLGVDVAWGHGPLVILHLAVAGAGMAALATRLGTGRLAAAVAGLAYGLSGYLVSRAGFFSINAAAAWLPWVLFAVEWVANRGPGEQLGLWPWLLLVAALWFQWLAGHAQVAWYSLLLAVAWYGWRTVEVVGWRRVPSRLVALLMAGVAAFLLAAPQLLPTLEYLSLSHRSASVDPELALTYSYWPWRYLELLAPGLFGHPALGDYWGFANYWEDALYLGILPLVLAAGGVVASLRKQGQHASLGRFLLWVLAAGVCLSLGANTPIFPLLFKYVPTFNLFRAPTRWSLLAVVSLSLLAAIGLTRWRPPEGRALYWARLGTAGAAAILGTALVAGRAVEGLQPSFLNAFALSGLWLLLSGALVLTQRAPRRDLWQLAVFLLVAADLMVATRSLNPTIGGGLYRGESRLAEQGVGSHRLYQREEAEYRLKFYDAFRFDTFGALDDWRQVRDWGLPNTPMLDRIPSANNFDPLVPARYQRWIERLESLPAQRQRELLSLMDVSHALLQATEGERPVYTRMEDPRRVRWVDRGRPVAGGEEALRAVTAPGFDPDQVVVLEGDPPALNGGGTASIRSLEDRGPNRVLIEVEAKEGGWLLLSDSYYPGWRAAIDGQSVAIYHADYLFRAVNVPAGTHLIEFSYRPASFTVGLSLFAVGLLLVVGAVWWWRS